MSVSELGVEGEFRRKALRLLSALPTFDAADYLTLNPDLAQSDPFSHFVDYGLWEGRQAIGPATYAGKIAMALALAPDPAPSVEAMARGYRGAMTVSPWIRLADDAPPNDRQVAEDVRTAMRGAGVEARLAYGAPADGEAGSILVNPARLLRDASRETALAVCRQAIVVVAEPPLDPGFAAQLPYLLAAGGALVFDAEAFALCGALPEPSVWLGWSRASPDEAAAKDHPLFKGLGRTIQNAPPHLNWRERPIDVLALNRPAPGHAVIWSVIAESLLPFRTLVHQPRGTDPADEVEDALRRFLYARAKVVLHLNDSPAVLPNALLHETAAAGAVLVSLPCRQHPVVRRGRHYLAAEPRRLGVLLRDLLKPKDGARDADVAPKAMRAALARAFDPEATGLAIVDLISRLQRQPEEAAREPVLL